MPYGPASCWADADTSGSKPLRFPRYYTLLEAKDLDHILTIVGRILTSMTRIGPGRQGTNMYMRKVCDDSVSTSNRRAVGTHTSGTAGHGHPMVSYLRRFQATEATLIGFEELFGPFSALAFLLSALTLLLG